MGSDVNTAQVGSMGEKSHAVYTYTGSRQICLPQILRCGGVGLLMASFGVH